MYATQQFSKNLHAFTELFLRTGFVLVATYTKPSLYFPYIPIQLLGKSLHLPCVWTLEEDNYKIYKKFLVKRQVLHVKPETKLLKELFTQHIIMPVVVYSSAKTSVCQGTFNRLQVLVLLFFSITQYIFQPLKLEFLIVCDQTCFLFCTVLD